MFCFYQLERDHMKLGLDYLLLTCSNNTSGQGWTRITTSQEQYQTWLNQKINFEQRFLLYCQGKRLVEDVQSVGTSSSGGPPKVKRSDNTSDNKKKKLGALLNESLSEYAFYFEVFRDLAFMTEDLTSVC